MKTTFWGFLLLIAGLSTFADAWPQWMGPQRDGVWRESGIVSKFPPGGPKVVWRTELDGGYSGPAVVDGRVYIMDRKPGPPLERKPGERGLPQIPGTERVVCLDEATGKLLWEHKYDSAYRIDYPAGPRTTPTVERGRVYVLGAMGEFRCLDAAKGDLVWTRNFMNDFHLEQPQTWGWAAHPLIYGEKIITLVGGTNSAVVAFEKATGKEVWRALTTREVGYAPPVIAKVGAQDQLIVWHSEAVAGLRPETGEVIWKVTYPPEGKPQRPEVTVMMPRVNGDSLFVSSFYHGALMLKFEGEKASVLWNKKSTSKSSFNAGLHALMTTPVLKDGYIYGVCGGGELRCLDAKTGERVWETLEHFKGKQEVFGTAFLTQRGEHGNEFFIWTDLGDLIIAKLSPQKYEEVSRVHLLNPAENARGRDVVWCAPAFANKSFFARNQKELICVSLAAES